MGKSTFLSQVKWGLEDNAVGLPNGLGSMNSYIYGIQMSRYYLFGGESGSGKTTIVDSAFVLSPYYGLKQEEFSKFKLYVNYFSFEQSARTKESKWASHIIYRNSGIWIPPSLSLGKTKARLTSEQFEECKKANEELDEMLDTIELIDTPMGPSDILNYLIRYGKKHGTWSYEVKKDQSGKVMVDKMKRPIKTISGWTPNDPNARHEFIVDHIAYANIEKRTLKENIDFISRTFVKFREVTHSWTFIVIQQFNTELSSVERQKFKKSALAPQRVDFGDSRYTFQDADVVFGTLNPYKYDIIEDYHGYSDIEKFKGLAVWLFLLKNRHEGPADKSLPYLMDPVALTAEEIPDPQDTYVQVEAGMIEDPLIPFFEKAEQISNLNKLYI